MGPRPGPAHTKKGSIARAQEGINSKANIIISRYIITYSIYRINIIIGSYMIINPLFRRKMVIDDRLFKYKEKLQMRKIPTNHGLTCVLQ